MKILENLRKAKRAFTRRAGYKAKCSKANSIEMGKRIIGSWFKFACLISRRVGYFCKYFARRNCTGRKFEWRKFKEYFWKTRSDQSSACERIEMRVPTIRCLLIIVCAIIIIVFIALVGINSEYLTWNFNDPELAIVGTLLHGFEFFVCKIGAIRFY